MKNNVQPKPIEHCQHSVYRHLSSDDHTQELLVEGAGCASCVGCAPHGTWLVHWGNINDDKL